MHGGNTQLAQRGAIDMHTQLRHMIIAQLIKPLFAGLGRPHELMSVLALMDVEQTVTGCHSKQEPLLTCSYAFQYHVCVLSASGLIHTGLHRSRH
jgi:hypothetical protein